MDTQRIVATLTAIALALTLAACSGDSTEPFAAAADEVAAGGDASEATPPADDTADGDGPLDGSDCGEGDRTIELDQGVARTFLCGTATATLTYDGTTEQLSGGSCNVGEDVVEIGFGTILTTPGELVPPDWFGVFLEGPGDGAYDEGAVTLIRDGDFVQLGEGTSALFESAVTLEGGRSRGSVEIGSLTATFACG